MQIWVIIAGDFPVSEQVAAQELSLPMYPEMTDAHIEAVGQAVARHLRGVLSGQSCIFDGGIVKCLLPDPFLSSRAAPGAANRNPLKCVLHF